MIPLPYLAIREVLPPSVPVYAENVYSVSVAREGESLDLSRDEVVIGDVDLEESEQFITELNQCTTFQSNFTKQTSLL